MKTVRKQIGKRCLVVLAVLAFTLFLREWNHVEKVPLLSTEGRSFERAIVTEIIEDNLRESGIRTGSQRVMLRIISGSHKGEYVEAASSSSYLFGAVCTVGLEVIAMISESGGELAVSVYSYSRSWVLYGMLAVFLLTVWLIGGKKGFYSVIGLVFTFVCIIWLFLPMIYRGVSPILAAVLMVFLTTAVTMYLIGGASRKTVSAMIGTVFGVLIAALFAKAAGAFAHISGYNVSDIEQLIYIEDMTGIRVGELMFAGILISSLGAVMDVAMSVSSTMEEIKRKKPEMKGKELFCSGIRVGRDMMGTMSNTLILAFTGGSINTLVYLYSYNYPEKQMMNMNDIAIELIQGVSSSMGVILTVPLVALIGAWLLGGKAACKTP